MNLLDHDALERSSVVANCRMNRERRLLGYDRELGINVLDELRSRHRAGRVMRWLDLCCGTANALFEASDQLGDQAEIVGVDLVDHFAGRPRTPHLRLVTASITTWEPENAFDLITCVHGLHYVGDKLGALQQIASWLTPDGLFVGNLDLRSVRLTGGAPVGRGLTTSLRASGLIYDPRTRRVRCEGPKVVELPYSYKGSDDQAGPNYTGQPAVDSYYTLHTPLKESTFRGL